MKTIPALDYYEAMKELDDNIDYEIPRMMNIFIYRILVYADYIEKIINRGLTEKEFNEIGKIMRNNVIDVTKQIYKIEKHEIKLFEIPVDYKFVVGEIKKHEAEISR